MTMIAGAAAKGVAKHIAKDEAKHIAKKKVQTRLSEGKERGKQSGKKFIEKTGTHAKKGVKKGVDRVKKHVSPMKSPPSYNVRRYHNMLIGVWMGTTIAHALPYFVNQTDHVKFWKQFWAIQFTFFILSILVMFQKLSKIAAYLGVAILLTTMLMNGTAILKVFAAFGDGLITPKAGNNVTSNTAANNALPTPQAGNNVTSNTQSNNSGYNVIIPRNTGTIST